MQSGTVTMGPSGDPTQWSGSIDSLSGNLIGASMAAPGAAPFEASIQIGDRCRQHLVHRHRHHDERELT